MKHTKGPWRVEIIASCCDCGYVQAGDRGIISYHPEEGADIIAIIPKGMRFNARLIAEAPRMLDLLKYFRKSIFRGDCVGGHQIDNLINRIEGKEG
jgi:hypothetical protein